MSENESENATIGYEDFAKIDLRVGTIVECEHHPNADKLLKLQVDLGPELGRRQICAGIRAMYEPADLVGRQIVVVANLAPRKLRGEPSQGMLLAANVMEDGQPTAFPLLQPDREVPPGSPVS